MLLETLWKAVLAVAVVWFLVGLYQFVTFIRFRNYVRSHVRKLPGIKWHPVLGVVSEFQSPGEEGLKFLRYLIKTCPRLSHWYFGPVTTAAHVYHPDTVKEILKTSDPKTVSYGFYKFLLPWLGDGLLTSSGHKWARHRRLLTPAFHFDILRPYNDVNNEAATVLVEKLEEVSQKGECFEAFTDVSLCTLEVMLKCAFSYPDDIQRAGTSHPYVKAVNTLGAATMFRAFNPIIYLPFIFYPSKVGRKFWRACNFVHGVATDVIRRRKADLKANNGAPVKSKRMLDFLDILLTARDEDGKGLTDREIRDEVDTFLFEGHDTTSSGISWMLYALAENPEWQSKCRQEIDNVLEGRSSDVIMWEDLSKLKILTACLKEALRLHTPVPLIEREASKDMYIDGHFLPRGSSITINLYGLMHNESVWEEPMLYKPERFLDDYQQKDSFAFLPFSAGPRNCIGQHFAMHEMKTIVARILRRFHLELDATRPVRHKISLVMRTEGGMYLRARPRRREQHVQDESGA